MTTSAPRPDSWTVRLCDSLEKVFPDEAPRSLNPTIPLVGYRGQAVSVQLAIRAPALRWPAAVDEVTLEIDAPGGVRAETHAVELVPVEQPAPIDPDDGYLRTVPGLFPDVLRPLTEARFVPVAGQWRSIWITLRIAPDAPAGPVEVRITAFRSAGAQNHPDAAARTELIGEHTVDLTIIGAELPPVRIPVTHWFHVDGLSQYYGDAVYSENHWTSIDRFLGAFVEAGGNAILTPVWTPPLDTAVGGERLCVQLLTIHETGPDRYEIDTTRLRRWMDLCARHGIRTLEIPHLFTQWGARATPAIYIHTSSGVERRFGWDVPATDPAYRRLMEQLIPLLRAELAAHWDGDVLFHISDEPTAENLPTYSAAKEVVADLLDGTRVIDAISDVELYESGAVDEPVVATNHAAAFFARGIRPVWLYYCVAQDVDVANRFIALPSARSRILGQQLFRESAAGFLHWGFNFYNTVQSRAPLDPFRDTCAGGGFYGGDAFLVYPGPDRTPWPSIRSRVVADAFDDYRALQLLEELTDRTQALAALGEEAVTLTQYPRDADYARRAAARVADRIAHALDGTEHSQERGA